MNRIFSRGSENQTSEAKAAAGAAVSEGRGGPPPRPRALWRCLRAFQGAPGLAAASPRCPALSSRSLLPSRLVLSLYLNLPLSSPPLIRTPVMGFAVHPNPG